MLNDTAFETATAHIRFGPGVTREVGMDLKDRGAKRILVVVDPNVAKLPPMQTLIAGLDGEGVAYDVYDRVRCEPTDGSFKDAIAAAQAHDYDAIVALGGGSAIDTAKAANLYSTYPADFLDYVNAPIGKASPPPGPLKPLIAIPTTAGTGSETTGVAICDIESLKVKTGISHRLLKPTLGIIDPDNTRTQPAAVAAAAGLDVLCHAIESFTAIPYTHRPKPDRPSKRPTYMGHNPVSDIWALRALEVTRDHLIDAVRNPGDDAARGQMLLASTIAGIGFGNAGVHLPHAMAYPIAGKVRGYMPKGYDADHAMVPHGTSVIVSAPAVFRFTAQADPQRHLDAAKALGAEVDGASHDDAGAILAARIRWFMDELDQPADLSTLGYTAADVPQLVEGAMAQQRLLSLAPRGVDEAILTALFTETL